MKAKLIFLTVVLVMVVLWAAPLPVNAQDEENKDNYGRVRGVVIDAETMVPVEEEMVVEFFETRYHTWMILNEQVQRTKTDKDGRFWFDFDPGEYTVVCYPLETSKDSIYAWGPDPYKFPETFQTFKIKKGKLTKFLLKAHRAGRIEVITVDKSNNRINLSNNFPDIKVHQRLEHDLPSMNERFQYKCIYDNLYKREIPGEVVYTKVYPGTYMLEINFSSTGIGYGTQIIDSIKVEKNKTTQAFLRVAPDDSTGIEGRVLDSQGKPFSKIVITAKKLDSVKGFSINGFVRTDDNGYYKIVGLQEGQYILTAKHRSSPVNFEIYHDFPISDIFIKAGTILQKTITEKGNSPPQ